jgi:uncharacterized protein YutE (UPF0331/DUF86 family)
MTTRAAPLDLDGRVLRARLRRIQQLLTTVPALGRIDPPRLVDEPVTALAAERLLTVLVELAFACNRDVAISALGRTPASYPESFDLAAEAGLISVGLAAQLQPSAQLHEVLVLDADPGQVALAVPRAPALYGEYVAQAGAFVAERAT